MPKLTKFPRFAKLPQDIQDDIRRKSVPGKGINFVMLKKPHYERGPPATLVHCRVDRDGLWGLLSTRHRLQQTAAVCSEVYNAVMRDLRNWYGNPIEPDPLMVIVPQPGAVMLDIPGQYQYPVGNNGQYWPVVPTSYAVAFLWRPLVNGRQELQNLWSRHFPAGLRTIYLLDMKGARRMDMSHFEALNFQAGPWYGGEFAFVDLRPNLVEDLSLYLSRYSDEEVIAMSQEINTLKANISWERELGTPPLPPIDVRILIPVHIS
ncbi:hypothetical protein NEMBOFW57_010850 [Staphylotrichum longicolle]|uniref:Uncharacterized protein n=1 Tax=Staphylotrichum longicolle TaxID=669026 RepID=A0AAD4HVM5_9PEZI|nr:hypothetical protein NEMBOFW57_010850 [Staphylotrichum longicolle]